MAAKQVATHSSTVEARNPTSKGTNRKEGWETTCEGEALRSHDLDDQSIHLTTALVVTTNQRHSFGSNDRHEVGTKDHYVALPP